MAPLTPRSIALLLRAGKYTATAPVVSIPNTVGISRRRAAAPVFKIFTRCHRVCLRWFRVYQVLLAGSLDTFTSSDLKPNYTEAQTMHQFLNFDRQAAANYSVTNETDDFIQLLDIGPHDQYKTITNAADSRLGGRATGSQTQGAQALL